VDGLGRRDEVDAFHEKADGYCDEVMGAVDHNLAVALWELTSPAPDWWRVAKSVRLGIRDLEGGGSAVRVLHAQTAFLRDIFGNPFHPVPNDPCWLQWNDGCISQIARAIYGEGDFGRMPVLADALEDAGCSNADILAHLRGPGSHVRGCFVLDLLLGKE
jgi:hypothetical protein